MEMLVKSQRKRMMIVQREPALVRGGRSKCLISLILLLCQKICYHYFIRMNMAFLYIRIMMFFKAALKQFFNNTETSRKPRGFSEERPSRYLVLGRLLRRYYSDDRSY